MSFCEHCQYFDVKKKRFKITGKQKSNEKRKELNIKMSKLKRN